MLLVDERAERSLIWRSSAKRLDWTGRESTVLKIRKVGNVISEERSHIGKLTLKAFDGEETLARATIMSDPVGEADGRDWDSLKSKRKHLTDLPLVKVGGKIVMTPGLDNYDLIRGREIRSGSEDGEPVATLSKLCWFVRGPTGEADTGRPATISVLSNDEFRKYLSSIHRHRALR